MTSSRLRQPRAVSRRYKQTLIPRQRWLECLEPRILMTSDFGDAPDTGVVPGTGNYNTLFAHAGPSHIINSTQTTLFLGARVDGEVDGIPNIQANGDDKTTLPDDEDGVIEPAQDLVLTTGTAPVVRVRATNTTGSVATLYAWIDINRDGTFDSATERTSVSVPNGTNNGTFTLTFPTIPTSATTGLTYARFRLSSDVAAAVATGSASGGEVEDYAATIIKGSDSTVNSAKSRVITSGANGGPALAPSDYFGTSVASLGDLDGDGITDLAVGAYRDDTGGFDRGAVYVQFMNSNGTVRNSVKLASGLNGIPTLGDTDSFGTSVTSLGDMDGDGVSDLAVGAFHDDSAGTDRGALYVLLMNTNGTVKSSLKIASGLNGCPTLANSDYFGTSVSSLGDLDGDGVIDLAVGTPADDSFGFNRGSVQILLLNSNGSVKSSQRFGNTFNGGPALNDSDFFGRSLASLGDLNGDGVTDLAVSAFADDTGGNGRGAVYILQLNANGTVKANTKIASGVNGGPTLADSDYFGMSMSSLADVDGDGVTDLAVGALRDDTGGTDIGAVHLLLLNSNGTVKSSKKLASGTNGAPTLAPFDFFGCAVSSLGDLDGDGVTDLAVGAAGTDAYGQSRGAVHVLFLNSATSFSTDFGDAPDTGSGTGPGNYQTLLANDGPRHSIGVTQTTLFLGARVDGEANAIPNARANGDDQSTAPDDEDGLLEPAQDLLLTVGTVSVVRVHATNTTGSAATLYGWIDVNRDGVFDNATERASATVPSGAINGTFTLTFPTIPTNTIAGATYARFRLSSDPAASNSTGSAVGGEVEDYAATITLPSDGTADSTKTKKLVNGTNGAPTIAPSDYFGRSVASLGDLDGDGINDVAVGAVGDDTGGPYRGAVHVLLLNANGTVKNTVKIASGMNGGPILADRDFFGSSITLLGDLDGDGIADLAVGATGDDTGGNYRGAVHILLMNANGTVKSSTKIASGINGAPTLVNNGNFGLSVALLDDLDGDGVADLAVGASTDTNDGQYRGVVHVLLLNSNGTVKGRTLISSGVNGAPFLNTFDRFGQSITSLGDLDGDGVTDLAIGAEGDDLHGGNAGSVYVLLLNSNATIKGGTKIASNTNGGPALGQDYYFGHSLTSLGDLDGDGVTDLAVGALLDDSAGADRGAVYVQFLNSNGTVKGRAKLASDTNGGPTLLGGDLFGSSVATLGDLNGDGTTELAIGAFNDDSGNFNSGAVYILFLKPTGFSTTDFGDAPDTGSGTGPGDYQTLLANGGPSHDITATQTTLFLGSRVDAEANAAQNARANGDDTITLPDDEDGLFDPAQDLLVTVGTAAVVRVRVTNTTGSAATLYGWIDINQDGVFDNATERTSVTIPNGSNNSTFTLTFPVIPSNTTPGGTYARFRLSSDVAAASSIGAAIGGEVEDYPVTLTQITDGTVDNTLSQKISGGLNGGPSLGSSDNFGSSLASLGDLDGDGVVDLAVGAYIDDTGGLDRGAVYVQFMNANGTVKNSVKIASGVNGGPALSNSDLFGASVTSLGDLDGDGITDLAVGTPLDDTNGTSRGAVQILFLNSNGTVKSNLKIASTTNGGPGLANYDFFGRSLTSLGDLDGDGVTDLAVGAFGDDLTGGDAGAVYVLFLNSNGTVRTGARIGNGTNGVPAIASSDFFGVSLAALGDLNGDGITDLAVGVQRDDTGGPERGAVDVLFLNANGTVQGSTKIASNMNGCPTLADGDGFGISLSALGDLDGDGVIDLATGAFLDDTGGLDRGALYVQFLNANGTVKGSAKIANGATTGPTLADGDFFGFAVTTLGDLNGDGVADLAVGAEHDDTGSYNGGAVHVLFLKPTPAATSTFTTDFGDAPDTGPAAGTDDYQTLLANGGPSHDISATQTTLYLGARVDGEADATQNTRANGDDKTTVPDDEDGLVEPAQDLLLTVGAAPIVRARATNTTGVPATLYGWIDINQDGVFDNATERTWVTVPSGTINGTFVLTFPTIPSNTAAGVTYARFRLSSDFAAADATGPALGGEVEDYAATISLRSDSTVDSTKSRKIANNTDGGPTLGDSDFFGISVASLGDLDGDGINDLATGAYRDDAFGVDRGALYVQFMNADGTVKNSVKIGSGTNGGPVLANGDLFGFSVASLGDLDGDGVSDLAVGAKGDDTGGSYSGALYVLLLNANGTVKSSTKIASGTNGGPTTTSLDFFGWSVAPLGDLNGDGVTDLAVGSLGDDTGGSDRGSIHVLLMNSSGTVKNSVKIASDFNGAPTLNDGDFFGASVASLGDLDGDGITDLAVGATSDDTGGPTRGAVHVLLLNANGTVKSTSKIASALNGGPILADNDFFGFSVASIGDLDGDGVTDLAVGTPNDSTGGVVRGAVYLLQLNSDATVKSSRKIASGLDGGPTLSDADRFGISVASLGDLDGNGVSDLAVGAYLDDTGGPDRGALHVLFLGAAVSLDFGDAPTSAQSGFPASYPTSLADNGARHVPTGPRLGADRDAEADGQSTASTRQQLSPPVDGDAVDEDGVYFLASLVSTSTATTGYINVNLQNAADAKLDAWVDFNQDGDWNDPGEQIFVNQPIISGDQALSFTVPANAATGVTFARFRVSTAGNLAPTGLAADGEVEDYPVNIIPLGSLDKTFDTDGITVTQAVPVLSDNGNRMAIQADGKVVVVGSAYNGSALQFAVLRYNTDGSLDTTFDGDGKTFTSFSSNDQDAQDVAIQPDGKIVVVGRAHNGSDYDFAIARYNPDGSLDTTFDGDGKQTLSFGSSTDVAYGVAIDSNNRIVVVGTTYNGATSDFAVARLNSNGSLDGNFDGDGKITIALGAGNDTAYAVAIQSTGEIVVVGDTSNGSNNDFGIIRLTDNGTLDTSFDGDGITTLAFGSSLDEARDVAIDANGRIVVVGATIDSGFTFAVARFNTNGSLDTNFDGDGRVTTDFGGSFSYAYGVAIQADGRIVVAGYSSDFSFLDDTALARYNANGSLDTSFDGDGKVLTDVAMFWNEGARDVAIQPDGGIVVAGSAVSGNSDINVFVARYLRGPELDITPPTLQSFARQNPSTSPTNADTLVFRATFSETVVNVDAADFIATGTTATITGVFPVAGSNGTQYDLVVSGGDLAGVNGLVGLNLAAVPTIADSANNTVQNSEPLTDETYLLDNTAPSTISFTRQSPLAAQTNADTLVFRVTFSEPVLGVDQNDFTVGGAPATMVTVTAVSTSVYDVTVSGFALENINDTVVLFFGSTSIYDLSFNPLPSTAPPINETYYVDNTAPRTNSFTRQGPPFPTNADTLVFRVTFNEAVTGVDAADFIASGTTAGVSVATVSATTYDVTLTGGDLANLTGTVGLDLASPTINDLAGNALPNVEPFTDETYNVDNTPPSAISFVRQSPVASLTNADTLVFRVTFSEAVFGVDAGDFIASGTTANLSVASVSALVYDVTLTGGDMADLNGLVGLDFVPPTIEDLAGNVLPSVEPSNDETYLVDNTHPTTISFVGQTPASPTNADTLVIRVTFNEAVTGVDAVDFVASGTTATISVDSVSALVYDVTLTGGDLTDLNGLVGLDFISPTINDLAGNALPSLEPTVDETYMVDNIAPATISFVRQAPATSPTNADTLVFRVTFSEGVTGVDATDFSASGTSATVSVAAVSPLVYDVTLSGGDLATVNGTIGLNLVSPVIIDLAGNALPNVEPVTDEIYDIDNIAPALLAIERHVPSVNLTNADILVFRVTFTKTVNRVDATDFEVAGSTATVNDVSVVGSSNGTQFYVSISGGDLSGLNGIVGLNLAAGQDVIDTIGNALLAAEPSLDETYLIDNTAPATTSIMRKSPLVSLTNADTLVFRVTFSEAVTGVDAGDFVASGTTAAVSVAPVSATVFDVTLTGGDLATLTGAVGLNFASPTISDLAGNDLPNAEPAIDETYAVDNTAPSTVSIVRQSPATNPTNADTLVFRVTFSEAVTGVDVADFLVTGATASLGIAVVSSTVYDVTLTGGSLANVNGNVGLSVSSPTITDLAGNALPNTQPVTDETYLLDNIAPVTTSFVRQSPATSPTNANTLVFRVTFNEAVTGVNAADFAASGTTASLSVASVSPNVYDVTLAGGDLANINGTVSLNFASPTISDLAGNALPNSEPATDDSYVLDNTAPVLTITPNGTLTNAAATIFTFQFGEIVTGFDATDVNVSNGTKGTFTAVDGDTFTLIVTPVADGAVSVNVGINAASDAASNGNTVASATINSDRTAPTLIITPNGTLTNATSTTLTFQYSETVIGFDASDVTVTNGTKGLFTAVDGDTYTLVVSPISDGAVIASVAANTAKDVAGSNNTLTTASFTSDRTAPSLTITPNGGTTNASQITFTFQFNEVVTGFDANDIVVTNGTKGAFTAIDGDTYTLAVAPITDGTVTVSVGASSAQDAAGNQNFLASAAMTSDRTAPALTITPNSGLTNASQVTWTFQFTEMVTGFSSNDVVVTNGTKGLFTAVDGDTYTLVVSPIVDGTVSASVAANAAQDVAGNSNALSTASVTSDRTVPSLTITPNSGTTNASQLTFTFQWSENVVGFDVADILVTNGTKGGFTTIDGDTYTLVVAPIADGDVTASVAANAARDSAGNNNILTTGSVTSDRTAPSLTITPNSGTANASQLTFTFQFSEVVTGFDVSDIVVTNGTKGTFTAVDGDTYTLLVTPVADGTVSVSVNANAASDAGTNGNLAATASIISDRTAPALSITPNGTFTNAATITFTFQFSEIVTGFDASDVNVTNGAKGVFAAVDGDTYTLVVTPLADGAILVGVNINAAFDVATNGNQAAIATITSDRNGPVFSSSASPSILENSTTVLTVIATDAHGPVSFAIVGGSDASLFSINASSGALQFLLPPDFEAPADNGADNVYNIQIKATDALGQTTVQNMAVAVTPVNDSDPLFTSASNISIAENVIDVGQVSATDADLPAQIVNYSISGGPDAERFQITSTGELTFVTAPDFENPTDVGGDNTYHVTIAATDNGTPTQSTLQDLVILVTNINETPSDIALSANSVNEQQPIGTAIGNFTTTDPDAGDTFSYSLESGPGSTDNYQFAIVNGQLQTAANLDFETQTSYSIRVRTTDQGGLSFEKQFTIALVNVNEPPTISSIADQSIPEDTASSVPFSIGDPESLAGNLILIATSSDPGLIPDASLVFSGTDTDRHLAITPTANQNGSATITITVGDGALSSSQTFQITVEAVDDLPEIKLNSQPLVFRVSGRKVVAIDSTATISDIDNPNLVFGGAVLQVSGQSAKDKLSVLKQDGISRKGKNVLLGKTVIGSVAGGAKGAALTIQLNDAATQSSVQLLLRSIGFKAPRNSLGDRTLHVQISNIQGADTPLAIRQMQVVP